MASPLLARKLKTFDYFTLAFGTMIGAGWLVLMDDWLARGGPGGAMLGFALGGVLLIPIGHAYGRLVVLMPDAASETAYAMRAFGERSGFFTGWMMVLAYLLVCPWEALAIGKITAYFFPALDRLPLYRMAGQPVYLPHLVLGLGLTFVITAVNYRGIQITSKLQNWFTVGFLGLFAFCSAVGARRGALHNFSPLFSHSALVSVLLILQIVPYFMTGFESVPKCAEEARPGFLPRDFGRAIYMALAVGAAFYVLVVAAVCYASPWRGLLNHSFATAVAFESGSGSHWLVALIFACAAASLVKIFNGNFVASSRLIFGLGRARLILPKLGEVHATNQTPWMAVLLVGAITVLTQLLGDNLLVSVTEVGSLASAIGWLASCASYYRLEASVRERLIAVLGMLVALSLVAIKLLPWSPGHLTGSEYLALLAWILLGLGFRGAALHRTAKN